MATTTPVTGLSQLGNVLMQGSADYANQRLRSEAEQRARAQQLADLQDQRRYQESQRDISRDNQFSDASRLASMNSRFDALQKAQALGLIAATDIGNIEKENAALIALQQRQAAESERITQRRALAKQRLDAIASEQMQIRDQIAADEAEANKPLVVDEAALRLLQEDLAVAANPGKTPSEADIVAQRKAAMDQYKTQFLQDRWVAQQEAKSRAANNKLIYQALAREAAELQGQWQEIGQAPAATLAAPVPEAPPGAQGGEDALKRFLESRKSARPQSAPSGLGVNDFNAALGAASPEDVGALRQARTAALAREYERLDAPIFQAQEQLGELRNEAGLVRAGLTPARFQAPSPFVPPPAISAIPGAQGELMARLYLESEPLRRTIDEQRTVREKEKARLLSTIAPARVQPLPPLSPQKTLFPAGAPWE